VPTSDCHHVYSIHICTGLYREGERWGGVRLGYDRVGETFDSVSKLLLPRPTDAKRTRWRRSTDRETQTQTPTASAGTSRVSLAAAGRADSQDRLVQHIVGTQETQVGASPTASATEVPSKVGESLFSLQKILSSSSSFDLQQEKMSVPIEDMIYGRPSSCRTCQALIVNYALRWLGVVCSGRLSRWRLIRHL